MKRLTVAVLVLTLALAFAVGCNGDGTTTGDGGTEESLKGPVSVGSKVDVEGPILAHMIMIMLEENGFDVVDESSTGQTDIVRSALLEGEIDAYPEYTGSAFWEFFPDADLDASLLNDEQALYDTVKELDAGNGVMWLARAPANNTWAMAITRELSESEGIVTWEDFAEYVNGGGFVRAVWSQEAIDRGDALPAFEDAYGFELTAEQIIPLAGGNTAGAQQAAAEGTDDANAAMAYGTDGTIGGYDLVVLEDTKTSQGVYQPTPTFRSEVIAEYPDIAGILDPVFASLDADTLIGLNAKVAVDGLDARDVARDYLVSEGFVG